MGCIYSGFRHETLFDDHYLVGDRCCSGGPRDFSKASVLSRGSMKSMSSVVTKDACTSSVGNVFVVYSKNVKNESDMLAVKVLDLDEDVFDNTQRNRIDREIRNWREVGAHENCVQLRELFYEKAQVYLVMERGQASLPKILGSQPLSDVSQCLSVVSQMLAGLTHLHSVGLVHRDIKPENYLAFPDSTVKLSHFKDATFVGGDGKLKDIKGSPPFMSPEMVQYQGYDQKTDIWSLGSSIYLLLYGVWPYGAACPHAKEVKDAVKIGDPPPSYAWNIECKTSCLDSQSLALFEPYVRCLLERSQQERPNAYSSLSMLSKISVEESREQDEVMHEPFCGIVPCKSPPRSPSPVASEEMRLPGQLGDD